MRKQVLVVVGALALGLSGGLAWAGGVVSLSVPFSFFANDKEMPAGRYEIQASGSDESKLYIKSTGGGGTVMVPIIERLADTGAKEPKVVFDKMDDGRSFLSEVHIPGGDGYLVGIAKGREKHVVVTGKE